MPYPSLSFAYKFEHYLACFGTFYDFFKRLWAASGNNLKSKRQTKHKRKPKKGKKGEKAPTTTPGKIKHLVERMIRHANNKTDLPSDRLFHFFQTQILTFSAKLGLLGDIIHGFRFG